MNYMNKCPNSLVFPFFQGTRRHELNKNKNKSLIEGLQYKKNIYNKIYLLCVYQVDK